MSGPDDEEPRARRAQDETVQAGNPERGEPLLTILGAGIAIEVPLSPHRRVVIGRGEQADVRIDHPSVSREHAVIESDRAGFWVSDLGSKNGTRIRGDRLEANARTALEPGVMAELGEIVALIRAGTREPRPTRRTTPAPDVQNEPWFGEAMRPVLALVDRVADDEIPVLLLGETGVGKEVLAERLHRRSRRASAPLLRVHCAAIAQSVFESELFGHEKGAFTGATSTKPGLLETAEGGTVFIDEVGELPAEIQTKLLRVLEDRNVQRIGALKPRNIDVRFIAATNRDLAAEVAAGRFRRDLYYRLNGVVVKIPSLKERRGEILELCRRFVRAASVERGKQPPKLSPSAEAAVLAHAWPGNVRELRHVMARAVLLSDHEIAPEHLVLGEMPELTTTSADAGADPERAQIMAALEQCAGNQTEAAKLLGVSRRTLLYKLDRLGIPRPRKR